MRKLGWSLLCALLALLLVEGASSLLLFLRDASTAVIPAERRHAAFDPELGWAHVPGVSVPDMYGPGKPLSINSQGFRGRSDVAAREPEGRTRIVCSGDSYTLGYGVGDSHTWVRLLEQQLDGVQTVNMGQGGYGVDQAYLWYLREEPWLEHSLQIFATIAHDFVRMELPVFSGAGKPRFQLVAGALRLENVPVPEPGWLAREVQPYLGPLRGLRSLQLVARARARWAGQSAPADASTSPGTELGVAVFQALAQRQREAGRPWVWLYLPTLADRDPLAQQIRLRVKQAAEQHGWPCIDLQPEFAALPEEEAAGLFIPAIEGYRNSAGHYSEAGNRWVAARVREHLQNMPELAELLAR